MTPTLVIGKMNNADKLELIKHKIKVQLAREKAEEDAYKEYKEKARKGEWRSTNTLKDAILRNFRENIRNSI